jgi:homogentisate 1,2-dioxygenase
MPIYHTLGKIPPKRHIAFRKPGGGIYAEQLMGHEGFTGTSALLYHVRQPTTIQSVRTVTDEAREGPRPDAPAPALPDIAREARGERHHGPHPPPLQCRHRHVLRGAGPVDEHFYRNAQADEVVYVAKGKGVLESIFGNLPFREGDYVVIHRGIMHRWTFDAEADAPHLLVMESRGHVRWPRRYRNEFGQLIEGAPFSERDIHRPTELVTHDETGDFPIYVKQYDAITEMVLDHHPFDVVGGTGTSTPGPSTSRTSSPSWAASTSPRRCTRPSRATAS